MRLIPVLAITLLTVGSAAAQNLPSTANSPRPPDSLPKDRHEGLTVSVDCYQDKERARATFGKQNPVAVGILPVEVFLRNETAQPIRIKMETIQLAIHYDDGRHEDIDWLTVREVARAIAHPKGPSSPKQPRFPIGVQTGADKKADQIFDDLKPMALDVDVLPPLGTIHGFLFFDLDHDMSLAARSSLYVPDVARIPSNKPLMFFEVSLGEK